MAVSTPGKSQTPVDQITDALEEEQEARVYQGSSNQWVLVSQRISKNRIATLALYYVMLNIIVAFLYHPSLGNSLV